MTVLAEDRVLEAARRLAAAGVDSARLDARLLWQHAVNPNPPLEGGSKNSSEARDFSGRGSSVPVDPSPKSAPQISTLPQGEGEVESRFANFIQRRLAREPLAYITGRKEFWSLDFEVGPGVLVPRPDTETLIEQALALYPDRAAPLRIADLGAGSGALLVAALSEFPNATGVGYEASKDAAFWACRNGARLAPERAEIRRADWSTAQGPFELVFANPPYIASSEIESLAPEVRNYEPRAALDGGPDGLDAYRALGGLLLNLVKPGGHALLEIGAGQAVSMEPLFPGLELVRIAPDLAGIPRCLVLKA